MSRRNHFDLSEGGHEVALKTIKQIWKWAKIQNTMLNFCTVTQINK